MYISGMSISMARRGRGSKTVAFYTRGCQKKTYILLLTLLKVAREPLETLVETVSRGGAGGLNEPLTLTEGVKAELVGDFCCVHGVGKILLVGEDEEECVAEFVFVEHALEFLACFADTLSVIGVDHEDDALGVLEVCSLLALKGKGAARYNDAREDGSCPGHRHPRR
jgi:hypothetical protein